MTVKTLSRKAISAITTEAHKVVYSTFNTLFNERYTFKQARCTRSGEQGIYILNGHMNNLGDFIPVSDMVVGAKLYNKEALPHVNPLSVADLFKQSFASAKAYVTDDCYVETKQLMEPITKFLAKYAECLDVFAGVYQNKKTYSRVFGVVVLLKDVVGEQRLSWELTIDDVDLEPHDDHTAAFR